MSMRSATPKSSPNVVQRMRDLEARFGYPFPVAAPFHAALERVLTGRKGVEYGFSRLVANNIHWPAEAHPGEPPFEPYDQPSALLARHFVGLFAYRSGITFGWIEMGVSEGSWLVDLNTPSSAPQMPAYYQRDAEPEVPLADGMVSWPVIDDLGDLDAAEDLFGQYTRARVHVPENGEGPPRQVAAQLLARYPRAIRCFAPQFERNGIDLSAVPREFDHLAGSPVVTAYRALLPVAEVLVARASSSPDARLAARHAADAQRLAETAPDYPPHLLLALLGAALVGDHAHAREVADQILGARLGVPLTQRWASLVAAGAAPFEH